MHVAGCGRYPSCRRPKSSQPGAMLYHDRPVHVRAANHINWLLLQPCLPEAKDTRSRRAATHVWLEHVECVAGQTAEMSALTAQPGAPQ